MTGRGGTYLLAILVLLAGLYGTGCGGSGGGGISSGAPGSATAPSAAIALAFNLLPRSVPAEITQFRFTGFDAAGRVLYGPVVAPKAGEITLTGVPLGVAILQIEYLEGTTVRGLSSLPVSLVEGQTFTVDDPPFDDVGSSLRSLSVSPTGPTLPKGTSRQFTATGVFSDGSQRDLTSSVTWTSGDAGVATVSNTEGTRGLATAVAPGTTSVAAGLGTVSGQTNLTVTAAVLVSLQVLPEAPVIPAGNTVQLSARGLFSDGSSMDLTTQVVWGSSNREVATVAAGGLASTAAPGHATLSATLGDVTGSTGLTVTDAELVSLAVTPAGPTLPKGTTQQFTATGVFSDGTQLDLTSSVTWTSGDAGVAVVSNTEGTRGLATAVAAGTTSMTARLGTVSGQASLTVTAAVLVSLQVLPGSPVVPAGNTVQLSATGLFSDGSSLDLTEQVVWASSNGDVATVAADGLASTAAPGQATLSATQGDVTGSTGLTVTDAELVSLAVTPTNPTVHRGLSRQFLATGTFSDGSTLDVTSSSTWAATDLAGSEVATISNAPGSRGLATAVNVGTSTITATRGAVSGSTTMAVDGATLVRIDLAPAVPAIPLGTTRAFTATGHYSDGSTADLTTDPGTAWASDDPLVATVDGDGLVTSVAVGQCGVSASHDDADANPVTGTTTLTVTRAVLTGLSIDPPNALSAPGTSRQYTALGTYSDGTTVDVTGQVQWGTSDADVAFVSNSPGTRGRATVRGGLGDTCDVTAALEGLDAQASLTLGVFVYAGRGTSRGVAAGVTGYSVAPATGELTPVGFTAVGLNNRGGLLMHPSGRFLYAVGADLVVVFSVGDSGALTLASTLTPGFIPQSVAADPMGRFLFLVSGSEVQTFRIDPASGSLTAGPTAAVGDLVLSAVVDPSGRFLYLANSDDGTVSAFRIDRATGGLAEVAGSPFPSGRLVVSMAVHPSGRFLYVKPPAPTSGVLIYDIDPATGGLGPASASAPAVWSLLSMDPLGRFLFMTGNSFTDDVGGFLVGLGAGALTPTAPATFAAGSDPRDGVVDPTGRFLYVTDAVDGTVLGYAIGAAGALAPVPQSPFASGVSTEHVVTTP